MQVIVVGGGIVGLATAWSLAKAGHAVTAIERGTIPDPLAASGDQHRIIRRAYGAMDGYARAMDEAFAAWDELWDDIGARHYEPAGVLCVSRAPHDEGDMFRAGYDRLGWSYEQYPAADAAERFPFLDPAAFNYAFFAADGGALFCQRIARDLVAWLRSAGVTVVEQTRVTAIDTAAGTVVTDANPYTADAVIVTAGAWTTQLFPDLADTLTTYRTAVVYLEPPADLLPAWQRAPVILSVGGTTVDGYGIPPLSGTGLKFGAGIHKRPAGADEDRIPAAGEGERIRDHFGPPFARIGAYEVREVRTCAYTFTADERFFATRRGRTWIVSACSGHGYKFGAAVGRRVARAVERDDLPGLLPWLEGRL